MARIKWIFRRLLTVLLLGLFFLIAACKTSCISHPKSGTSLDQMHGILQQGIARDQKLANKTPAVPSNVSNALLSSSNLFFPPTQDIERRFNITANKTPASAFFMGLVNGTRYNMV